MQTIMKLIIDVILSIIIISIIFVFGIVFPFLFIKSSAQSAITSSPVEEMYHRELVTTLDSILDARFGAGCCEEIIDSDDVSINYDQYGKVILPDSY